MLFIWIPMMFIILAIGLPILRFFGIVDWKWKWVLSVIWVPMLWVFIRTLLVFLPIIFLSLLVVMCSDGKPI